MNEKKDTIHYFSKKQQSLYIKSEITYQIEGKHFKFETANGVFSKGKIDFGSEFMVKTFLNNESPSNENILDLGCGYGYVGIVIGKFFPGNTITFVDINQRAINLTNINAMRNFLGKKRIFDLNFLDENQRAAISEEKYNCILLNPPIKAGKEIMKQMFLISLDMLGANGKLYVVIKTSLGAKSWQEWFSKQPSIESSLFKKGGYRVFVIKKMLKLHY